MVSSTNAPGLVGDISLHSPLIERHRVYLPALRGLRGSRKIRLRASWGSVYYNTSVPERGFFFSRCKGSSMTRPPTSFSLLFGKRSCKTSLANEPHGNTYKTKTAVLLLDLISWLGVEQPLYPVLARLSSVDADNFYVDNVNSMLRPNMSTIRWPAFIETSRFRTVFNILPTRH